MSTTGLEIFDKTLQATNIWLDEIMEQLGPDRAVAWKVLSTVLHKLRDRLPLGLAVHLGAQLPLLIRGVYYDQFEPENLPVKWHTADDFVHEIHKWLSDIRPVNAKEAVEVVFRVLSRHISHGQVEKVRQALPTDIRTLWPEAESQSA